MPTLRINEENENIPHFITITVIEWIDIFTKPEYFKVIIESLKYCQNNKGLKIFEYVIMTNHIHLIVKAKDGNILSQVISDFKKHTTKEIFKLLEKDNRRYILNLVKNSFSRKKGYENQLWQRENYPEPVLSEKFLLEKINYIYKNPTRKEFVALPENWFYSSARNRILDDNNIINLDDY
ncbi:MAG: transposase [Patescibacteria group bacterium]|jgi:putative transposase|nr:transposase [Patescibacteria group bacterium]